MQIGHCTCCIVAHGCWSRAHCRPMCPGAIDCCRYRLCYNCISSKSHTAKTCRSKYTRITRCCIRRRAHRRMSCRPVPVHQPPQTEPVWAEQTVIVSAGNGRKIRVRALIDQASEATFVTERVMQLLAAPKGTTNVLVRCVGRRQNNNLIERLFFHSFQ